MLHYLKTRPQHQSKRAKHENLLRTKVLRRFYAGKVMNELSAKDVLSHRNKRVKAVSPGTVNRELAQLSAAITVYNLDHETDLPNPVNGRKLKQPESRLRWITKAECSALVNGARELTRAPYLADFIILATNTGMRKNELLGLEWRRVDLQSGLIYLEAEHTKAAKRRTIPTNATAKAALISLKRYQSENCPASKFVITKSGARIGEIQRSFKHALNTAGIRDFRIHDLRHTSAAWLVQAGVPLPEVRDLLGHKSIQTTEIYAHLAPENIRAAVEVLDNDCHNTDTMTKIRKFS